MSTDSSTVKTLQPLLTVITPCLNASENIPDTLYSVLATRKILVASGWELEHIIVDGASRDGTIDIVQQHAQDACYCQLIRNVMGGPYAAMNVGLSFAQGHYVHVINSDDLIIDPQAYASFLQEGYRQNACILMGSIVYFRRPRRQLRARWIVDPLPDAHDHWKRRLSRGLHYPHPGFIAERELYRSEGFDERYTLSADYKLMQSLLLRACSDDRILTMQQPLVAMAEGGATGSWSAILRGWLQLRAINRQLGIDSPAWRRYLLKLLQRLSPARQPLEMPSYQQGH